jgi:hypothetical protein
MPQPDARRRGAVESLQQKTATSRLVGLFPSWRIGRELKVISSVRAFGRLALIRSTRRIKTFN